MPGASDYLEVNFRKHIFRTGSFTKPAALYISLHTADPTDDATGTEVSGGSYARVQRDPLDANWSGVSATDGVTKNVAAVTYPAPTGNWGLITHAAVWDALTGGNMLISGALGTPKTVNSGDPAPSFAADAIVFTFS